MKNYIEKFTIPFWQAKIIDWETKKEQLMSLYNNIKGKMVIGDQYSDYDVTNNYYNTIQTILLDDLIAARKELKLEQHLVRVNAAWFQMYEKGHHHPIHNHGIGGFSSVCYIEYDPLEHEPTRFVAPFNDFRRNDMLEYIPEGIEEGSIIFFPCNISHYVAPSKSDKPRLILSFNIS